MQYVAGPSLADAATPLAAAPLRQLVDGLARRWRHFTRSGSRTVTSSLGASS
jgi:hypothetical protein